MDRVRLGRALGYGTRHAAKTLAAVVEAAASQPDGAQRVVEQRGARPQPPRRSAVGPQAQSAGRSRGRSLKQSFWRPLAAFSGALWLRVTGMFFALIALSTASGAWRFRAALQSGATPGVVHRFWICSAFAAVFGYFAASGFLRATLLERRAVRSLR